MIKFNEVTWYSKLLAVVIFICSTVLSFWFGVYYQKNIPQNRDLKPEIETKPDFTEIKKEQASYPDTMSLILENGQANSMCYYYSKQTEKNQKDYGWITFNIKNQIVNGEFWNVSDLNPKTGIFKGTITSSEASSPTKRTEALFSSQEEGNYKSKEELILDFNEESITILSGDMVKNTDGTYIYKDKTKLTPSLSMSRIDCKDLLEIQFQLGMEP